ncbi:endonuclease [Candidatus Bathyarchaeota archaeon]|nr:endonuclease [Candidatus Bathyarchaeota archaeon]
MNLKVGIHVSIAGSVDKALDRAKEKECDVFQIFTRNPRGWAFAELEEQSVKEFRRKTTEYQIAHGVVHLPYLPNLSSPKSDFYEKSIASLIAELHRCERLSIPYLVFHPGSHLGEGMDVGLKRLVSAINRALGAVENDVMLVMENTAGQKNSMGATFEELQQILDQLTNKDRVGICLDTCHAFARGYDLRNRNAVRKTLDEFQKVLGFEKLAILHLNDSCSPLGSGIDKHEHIGMGRIGEEGFRELLRDDRIRAVPMILETPIDSRRDDIANIAKIRSLAR